MKKHALVLLASTLFFVGAFHADDLTGAERLLCSSGQAMACDPEGGCESAPPWSWNIPAFIEIDLKEKTLSTTEASEEKRVTPIATVKRDDGRIFLQGIEQGRAFSFVIDEASGLITVAVARDGFSVSVFGACTPKTK